MWPSNQLNQLYYLQTSRTSSYDLPVSRTRSATFEWAESAYTISKWAESAHTTSKWSGSAHTTSEWTKPAVLRPNELNQLISPPHELNELNNTCVSYRAQWPVCELSSSTTYMWATNLNNPNCVQQALQTKSPLMLQVGMDSWKAYIVPFPCVAVFSHWVFLHRGF